MRAFLLLVLCWGFAQAAIPPKKAGFEKSNLYIQEGAIIGGEAQKDLVIAELRRSYSIPHRMERIVLEVEPTKGQSQRAGYFHVSYEQKLNRVVINLSGVAAARESLDQMALRLKKSPVIAHAEVTMDPEDRSATLALNLKPENYQVEAFELKTTPDKPSRVVVDIQTLKKASK